ncbi:MAG: alpha/beta fold hydrolase [Reyranellaceae bacterium]
MAVVLPAAVPGTRQTLMVDGRTVSFYADGPAGRPLLLIHSVNAAGSAYEVKPLYEHYRAHRPVYALELPGFGFSDRRDAPYMPRLMSDAVLAILDEIARRHDAAPDVLALSLSCEFAARAATERPQGLRSLALVSPTGFSRRTPPGGSPRVLAVVRFPLWDRALFRLLTTRASIRYFLRCTWGSPTIDEGMVDYDYRTARQPGARYAPYHFVSGFLFSPEIFAVYQRLALPVWLVHGTRGDFVDYSRAAAMQGRPNWRITVLDGGALPHFEQTAAFLAAYDSFLAGPAAR